MVGSVVPGAEVSRTAYETQPPCWPEHGGCASCGECLPLGVRTRRALSGWVSVEVEGDGLDIGGDPDSLEVSAVDASVAVLVGDDVGGVVVDAVVVEVGDDSDGQGGGDVLAGDGGADDPGVPEFGAFAVAAGDTGRLLLVVVSTTKPGI